MELAPWGFFFAVPFWNFAPGGTFFGPTHLDNKVRSVGFLTVLIGRRLRPAPSAVCNQCLNCALLS